MRWIWMAAVVAAACGGDDGIELSVSLVTDYRPVEEFDRVEVRLLSARGSNERSRPAQAGDDFRRGVPVADFDDLAEGDHDVAVELFVGTELVAGVTARLAVTGDLAHTAVIASPDCRPTDELCNGLDDDCDGTLDEGTDGCEARPVDGGVPDAASPDAEVDSGQDLGPPRDERLPMGRANFVAATGALRDADRSSGVRIGTYAFDAETARVEAATYMWGQSDPAMREGTGSTVAGDCAGPPDGVRVCEVLTVEGYTGAPTDRRSGSYELSTSGGEPIVAITWDGDVSPWWETWSLRESDDGRYVIGALEGSRGYTHGYLYGSDAGLDRRRPMVTVQAHPGPLAFDFVQWNADMVTTRDGLTWRNSLYDRCDGDGATTWMMTHFQPSSPTACRAGCVPPYEGDTSIQYYIQQVSSDDRRDTFWHWCTCLAQANTCYPPDGNSHVKPMMQILDDQAAFRGWVGVEASFYQRSHVDPRSADMLQVFRVYEP